MMTPVLHRRRCLRKWRICPIALHYSFTLQGFKVVYHQQKLKNVNLQGGQNKRVQTSKFTSDKFLHVNVAEVVERCQNGHEFVKPDHRSKYMESRYKETSVRVSPCSDFFVQVPHPPLFSFFFRVLPVVSRLLFLILSCTCLFSGTSL